MMLNKTFYLILLSLIPLLGFSQANSQYPDSGNKIRLGFQTTGDGLIWRDTQPKVAGYQPINNKAAWIVLDTVNNKFYHYKQSNNTWNLAGGQDIDTANLIATKYNLGFKLSIADTQNMLTPYWRSGRFSGVLPVANGGTNASTFTEGSVVFAGASGTYTQDNSGIFFDNTNNRLGINTAAPLGLLEARSTVGGTNNGLFSLYNSSATSPYFTFQKARGTVASPSAVLLNDGIGELTFSGYAYSTFNSAVVLRAFNYLAPGATYLNGGFKILINSQANGGLVDYLNIISNGNVGIGDGTIPTERLHIGGNARITGNVGAGIDVATARLHVKGSANASEFALKVDNSGGTNLLSVQNNGNVGIGTESPTSKLEIFQATYTGASNYANKNIKVNSGFGSGYTSGTIVSLLSSYDGTTIYATDIGHLYDNTGYALTFSTNDNTGGDVIERMRITSGGNVLFNCKTIPTASVSGFTITGTSSGNFSSSGSSTAAYNHFLFYNGNGIVGSISTSGSTTSYTINSDYRLKEDLKEIKGLEKINNIKVYDYKWKNDNFRMDGVLAHELQEVIPYAVQGEKDGKEMQGVDYSKLVPILIKSVQELSAEIDILKQEIINLKNK